MRRPIKFVFLSVLSLSFALAQERVPDDSTISRQPVQQQNCINAEFGFFFAGSEHSSGWGTPLELNLSYGTSIAKQIVLLGNLDYYHYQLNGGGDFSTLSSEGLGKRQDIAIYASLSLAEILVVGMGAYYTKSDSVYAVDMGYYRTPWDGGGLSTVRFFYIIGAKYEIQIVNHLFLPIGLFFRQSYDDRVAPVMFRTGLGVQF